MTKDFLSIADLSVEEVKSLFDLASELKTKQKRGEGHAHLQGQTLAMLFMKPSTRTRVSFEVAMNQLGGHALYLSPNEVGMGKREAISDVARVLSRYVNGIMARLFDHDHILELAQYASVPVINGLTDLLHPCQVMGDMLTILEHRGNFDDLIVAFIGDGNNVANSWINMASKIPFTLRVACPPGYEPNGDIITRARAANTGRIEIMHDPVAAATGAHILYTDVWASMGQEAEAEKRKREFKDYLVDSNLMKQADKDAKFMHCLPAHRGEEVTAEVMESEVSIIFDQAENRLHMQKALLVQLMGKR